MINDQHLYLGFPFPVDNFPDNLVLTSSGIDAQVVMMTRVDVFSKNYERNVLKAEIIFFRITKNVVNYVRNALASAEYFYHIQHMQYLLLRKCDGVE